MGHYLQSQCTGLQNKIITFRTINDRFNEFAMRFVVDIIIAQLRKSRTEKGGAGREMV